MKKVLSGVVFITLISVLLIGCSGKNNDENNNANENEEVNEEMNEEENEEENEEVSANETNEDENNSEENLEEETFAEEINILDVEVVLNDQEEVSEFNANENTVIEHNELMYVEHDFITEVLDYELTYDEENTFAEIFDGKGDFKYEPAYEDVDGALMDLGQIYVEDLDKYENITDDEEELYKFIEYEGNLYIPERFINVFMKSPVNYERRDQVIEVGLHSETKSLYDIGVTGKSSSAEATQNASDVTVEGKNYDGGIALRNINSSSKSADIDIDYNYSQIKGFIHNHSDDETIEIRFQYNDDKTLDAVDLEPNETHEFDYDVKGEAIFKILAKGEPGRSSEAVIIGEVN